MRPVLLLFLLLLAACDPCADYCAQECECLGTPGEACEDTCSSTLELYSGPERAEECSERYTALEETCS